MSSQFHRFDEMSIFHDKGEVKHWVEKVIQERDSEANIDRMRKIDFSYVFILSKRGRSTEVELTRSEIEASQEWRKGNIDPTLQKKIENTIVEL